jgi:hypothetical protein
LTYVSHSTPSLLGNNGLEALSSSQTGIQEPVCPYQTQSAQSVTNNAQIAFRWMAPGLFLSGCSSHNTSNPPRGSSLYLRWYFFSRRWDVLESSPMAWKD